MNDTSDTENVTISTADEHTVNYVFPVEVIVVAALTEDDHRAIEERIWNNFGEAFGQSA